MEKPEACSKWKKRGSKQVGGKVEKSGKSPNRKLLGSKWVGGKVGKSGKSPKLKNKG
ncbi:unknown [Clostridium sp. CAG:127]|nr:unknown [Clostridium sp. CAG:127]